MSEETKAQKRMKLWRKDWCLFAKEVLNARLDEEQKAILRAVQTEKMVAVASGTARGKDYIAAVAAMCLMYLKRKTTDWFFWESLLYHFFQFYFYGSIILFKFKMLVRF